MSLTRRLVTVSSKDLEERQRLKSNVCRAIERVEQVYSEERTVEKAYRGVEKTRDQHDLVLRFVYARPRSTVRFHTWQCIKHALAHGYVDGNPDPLWTEAIDFFCRPESSHANHVELSAFFLLLLVPSVRDLFVARGMSASEMEAFGVTVQDEATYTYVPDPQAPNLASAQAPSVPVTEEHRRVGYPGYMEDFVMRVVRRVLAESFADTASLTENHFFATKCLYGYQTLVGYSGSTAPRAGPATGAS